MTEVRRITDGANFKVPERFKSPAITLAAGSAIVPCASASEIMPVTLAPFKDHGRPAFVASTIKSRSAFKEAAAILSEAESSRLNDALTRTMNTFLEEGNVRSDAVLRSTKEGKPVLHMLIIGNPFQDNSLRLYYHLGEYQGAKVIFQDARTTKKGAEKVEKVLKEGGYQSPKNWDNKSTGRGGR